MARLTDWLPAFTPRRRQQLWYGPLLGLAMALALVRLLAYARFLSIEGFGAVSACVLVSSSFCMLGCAGLMPMLQREWPVYMIRGQYLRGRVRAAQCMVAAVATGSVLMAASAGGLSVAGLVGGVLAMAIVHGVAQQFFLIVTTESRSAGNALQYARQQFARSAAMLGVGLTAVLNGGGAIELIACEAAVTLIAVKTITLQGDRTNRVRLTLILAAAVHRLRWVQWRVALTMMSVMLVSFAMVNVDRWLASGLLEVKSFGLYSFAAIVLSIAQACQALINASGYPLIARRHAVEGPFGAFRVSMKLTVLIFAGGLAVLVPTGWVAGLIVQHWYPDYAAAGPLLLWFAVIGLLRAADFWSSFLIVAGHESRLLLLNATACVGALLIWSAWVSLTPGATSRPSAYAVLAGLVTGLGAVVTFAAAWHLGGKTRADARN